MNSTLTMNFNHIWIVRSINEDTMKQLQLFDYYVLGKAIDPLFQVKEGSLVNDAGFDAMAACRQLKEVTRKDSVFLSGTRRAAESLVRVLIEQFGAGIQDSRLHISDPSSLRALAIYQQLTLAVRDAIGPASESGDRRRPE
ncbi:MAG: hypothetical protein WBM14_16005 [Terracidiphilus sp.]